MKYVGVLILLTSGSFADEYTGSARCGACHVKLYERWRKTLMANILQDVKTHPEAIIADFSKPNPLVTFSKDEIAFTYGSKWKQRYFTKRGNDYFVFPAQWDVKAGVWRKYSPAKGTDWWTEVYPTDQMARPTGPLCDGCHSVNYNLETQTVTEWNVGCEKCHGPGAAHAATPKKTNIVNPARLDEVRATDVCIQCHSQGRPLVNPVNGKYYDWPVSFTVGMKLADHWALEDHKLGETTFTHFPDGSAHKNRMQGNDFVTSRMYEKGIRCANCHDVHGTGNPADTIKAGNALCLTCHAQGSPNGPRGTLEQHTGHKVSSTGSECIACHMPRIAQTIDVVNVRSHTFRFITPSLSEQFKIPNACVQCHKDKSNAWAAAELKKFSRVSPWRM